MVVVVVRVPVAVARVFSEQYLVMRNMDKPLHTSSQKANPSTGFLLRKLMKTTIIGIYSK